MTREKYLWQWLSKARLYYRKALHMNRVENSVGAGMPDVEGYLSGSKNGQFWIELKSGARPKDRTQPVRLKVRDRQVAWHKRRRDAGQETWFLVQVGSGTKASRYLIPGKYAKALQKGLAELAMDNLGFKVDRPQDAIYTAAGG